MLLPRVGETHSTAQFIYSVFCQCPADGGDCVSRVNGNKNCMRNAMSREISHVNLKKKSIDTSQEMMERWVMTDISDGRTLRHSLKLYSVPDFS